MPNLKTSISPFVLLVTALEVQFEILDRHPQNLKNQFVFLLQSVELRFEFRSEPRIAKLKFINTMCFPDWDG